MADGVAVLDLDAMLAAKREAAGKAPYLTPPDEQQWGVIKLGGQELRAQPEGNQFYAFEVGDMVQGATLNYVLSFFHPADQYTARQVMENMGLDMEGINLIMDELTKVVVGRPTQPPTNSQPSQPSIGPSSTAPSSETGAPPDSLA